jgi:hypothetical protein
MYEYQLETTTGRMQMERKFSEAKAEELAAAVAHKAFQPIIFKLACAEVARRLGPGAGPKGDELFRACRSAAEPAKIAAGCMAFIADRRNAYADRRMERAGTMALLEGEIEKAMREVIG